MSFELRVEFSGLCMYLVSPEEKRAAVLMPDCRTSVDPVHADGEEGVHHVGYLRFDLANVAGFAGVPAGSDAFGPQYEVVHRFDFQKLEFPGFGDEEPLTVEDLGFPEFEKFTENLRLKDGMFDDEPPEELLMRTVLRGGVLKSDRVKSWRLPDDLKPGSDYKDNFASRATWTRTVTTGTVAVRIAGFDGSSPVTLELKPVEGEDTVTLKIANLCKVNPLEWEELESEVVTEQGARDRDFKWLYRLLESTTHPLAVRLGAVPDIPVPVLEATAPSGVQGCMGAIITTTSIPGAG
jgi:hypothetical protein